MHRFLVANFKSNKNSDEVIAWLKEVGNAITSKPSNVTVIVCPQFVTLERVKAYLTQSDLSGKIHLGSQDISGFGPGAFTGEVNAQTLATLAIYSITGHSERRTLLGETSEDIEKKLAQAKECAIRPILCVSEETIADARLLQDEAGLLAFEPPGAIGSGAPASQEKIAEVIGKIKELAPKQTAILYGGSVNKETMGPILNIPGMQGFLVGTASLSTADFLPIYYGLCEPR